MKSRVRVAIIGPSKIKNDVMPIFMKNFLCVIYFPVNSIKLTAGKMLEVTAGNFNLLNFDYVLFLPDGSQKEFYSMISQIISKQVKVSASKEALIYFWNKATLMSKLSSAGIDVMKVASISQDVAASFICDKLKLPVILRTPQGADVYVSNEQTLRNVLSLFPAGHTVSIQKPFKNYEKYIAFVSEHECVGYKKVNGNPIPVKIGSDVSSVARKIKRTLGVDFCVVSLVKKNRKFYVYDVSLTPDFDLFYHKSGKDLTQIMTNEIIAHTRLPNISESVKDVVKGLGEVFDKFVRWISNETGNSRAPKQKL